MPETIQISQIIIGDRLREDQGDIDSLANSIKEFSLIQPIIVYRDTLKLSAGGRRITAVMRLGWTELLHGRDFIWRDEEDELRRRSVELEENLKRKELTWQEQVKAKKQLLELMQQIYGASSTGRSASERASGAQIGFGLRQLSSMLGDSIGQLSKDLQIADAIEKIPALSISDTKESAFRRLNILAAVASMRLGAKVQAPNEKLWTLYEGDFNDNIHQVADESVDLVYTDLPFGVGLGEMSRYKKGGFVDYPDSIKEILGNLVVLSNEAYRVLRDDRYCVFFFGFNYYRELVDALEKAGFSVNYMPVVWIKRIAMAAPVGSNPSTQYGSAYCAALVSSKGSPAFIKPGQSNVIDIPPIASIERLQIAQQPVELVTKFLLDMTTQGATVLDLMAGSGTTGEACVRNKRRVILFEREPAACVVIKARLGAL